MTIEWDSYDANGCWDDMMAAAGRPRDAAGTVARFLASLSIDEIQARQKAAEAAIEGMGITFTVYGEGSSIDRAWPFDIIPRIIAAKEWATTEAGLRQRLTALNLFIGDLYSEQKIVKDGVFPGELLANSKNFRRQCMGVKPPFGVWAHICGSDLIRDHRGDFYVLEDNLRVPSGVSYMLENRKMMMRLFPELFATRSIRPVQHYPDLLLENLRAVGRKGIEHPTVAVLTPGAYNSAYFEHAFLAQQMGVELVEGRDLFVQNDTVYMRTTRGPARVHVIYRRVDDDFLDPLAFRKDSMLGVPGLFAAYRAGRVTLANAIGTGVADDKSIYPYVPDMIRYYLSEEPILNNVPTFMCYKPEERDHVLAHLPDLVVKEVHGAGGYGMLVGPASTTEERAAFRERILANPEKYIAQPTLALSTCPTFVGAGIAPRHIDLRPYVLSGTDIDLVPGGLTRVALREGSLVVNSSQGGGTKDTWVLA